MLYVTYWTHGNIRSETFISKWSLSDWSFFNPSECQWIVPGTLNYSDFE